jgi:hypothetical protein
LKADQLLWTVCSILIGLAVLLLLRVAWDLWSMNRRCRRLKKAEEAARSALLRDELIGAAAPALDAPGAAGEAEGHSAVQVDACAVPDASQLGIDVNVTLRSSGGKARSGAPGRSGPGGSAACLPLVFAIACWAVSLGGSARPRNFPSEPCDPAASREVALGSASPAAAGSSARQPADAGGRRAR